MTTGSAKTASRGIIAFNATAYDGRPSGALHRAVGLAAALGADRFHRVLDLLQLELAP